jgi:hypothetical protein
MLIVMPRSNATTHGPLARSASSRSSANALTSSWNASSSIAHQGVTPAFDPWWRGDDDAI